MPRVVSFIVLLAIILLIGSMFFQVMVQFIVPLFLAAVLVVIFKPLHHWMLEKCGYRPNVSAALTTLAIVLIVLLPIAGMLARAVFEGKDLYLQYSSKGNIESQVEELAKQNELERTESDDQATQEDSESVEDKSTQQVITLHQAVDKVTPVLNGFLQWIGLPAMETAEDSQPAESKSTQQVSTLHQVVDKVTSVLNGFLEWIGLPAMETASVHRIVNENIHEFATPLALSSVKILASMLFGLAIMVLTLYYFFADGPNMIAALMRMSPLNDTYEQELLDKFGDVSRAVVVAVLLSATVQGLLAGIGYYFAGVEAVFFLTAATAFLAMVPFVGAAAIWVPVCLYLYFYTGEMIDGVAEYPDGRPVAAIVLAIYCGTLVSMSDNVVKPLVLHGQSNLHPLLALLSVIGGIQTLGPIGILVGPMLVAFLQALLNMLNKELHLLGKEADEKGTPVVFATGGSEEAAQSSKSEPSTSNPTKTIKKSRRGKKKR